MTMLDNSRNHPSVGDDWETNHSVWPVIDTDGTWLICTRTERRLLTIGLYEYRALLGDMKIWS